jgi:5-methylcytosine-specific restriction protein A
VLRKCLDCNRRTPDSRCPEHQRQRDRAKDARRGGHADWRDRAAAVNEHKAQQGPWCPGYGVPSHWVIAPNRLSADHPVPLALGGPLRPDRYGVLCIRCQGRQGAALANQMGGDR